MTTAALAPSIEYLENGVTLEFAVPFRFLEGEHLIATRIAADGTVTTLTYGTQYSATGGETDDGGTLTLVASTAGATLKIRRETPRAQETDYATSDTFPANSHEDALDRAMLIDQEQDVRIDDTAARALLVPEGEEAPAFPATDERTPGHLLGFDADGSLAVLEGGEGADAPTLVDLAGAGGAALVGFGQAGDGSATQSVQSKLRNSSVHLMDKIPQTEWAAIEAGTSTYDASADLGEALDLGKRVILPIGTVLANFTDFASGMELEGECRLGSVIRPYDVDGHLFLADSGGAAVFLEDLRFANFTAYGYVETEAFLEQCHLFFLNGVKGALLDSLNLKGFRGDGICLGSGLNVPGTTERHNSAVLIRNCEIDGINNDNRNGISVLDCDGFTLRDSVIRNTTRANMPGPIDFEPDANAFHLIRDVLIEGVSFFDNGGNMGQIAFPIPAAVTELLRNVTIRDCASWNYAGTGYDIYLDIIGGGATPAIDQAFRVENFAGRAGNGPFWLDRCRGVYVNGTWADFATHSLIGFETTTSADDVTCDVRFDGVGDATGFYFCNVDGLTLSGQFNACAGDAAGKYPILAGALRTSSRVTLDGVEIIKRAAQTIGIANQSGTHTFTPATNRQRHVTMTGLTSEFRATAPGETFKGSETFDPGSLAAGAKTAIETVTVTGAALGDAVSMAFSQDLAGVRLEGWVSAADTVSYFFENANGADPTDLASGTVTATVTKALA